MNSATHTAVTVPHGFMKTSSITKLTDAFQEAFSAAYNEEKQRKQDAKTRLRAALDSVSEFENSTAHEEYRPA